MKTSSVRAWVALVALVFASVAAAGDKATTGAERKPARVQAAYPVIVTTKVAECRDFYVKKLGFELVFEASWFVYVAAAGNPSIGIAFMTPDHPSQPPGPEKFSGEGMFFTLQVEDAAAEFARLKRAGVTVAYPVRDEPWGQRRFGVYDPAGVWLDVVQQIEPAPGFWDKYMK